MKVIIAGSRDFTDYDLLREHLSAFRKTLMESIEIVSGTARGTDRLGERYAMEERLFLKQFPADWAQYGKQAGYLRNVEMSEYADYLIAFWDGKSPGTKHMLDIWKRTGKPFKHIPVESGLKADR